MDASAFVSLKGITWFISTLVILVPQSLFTTFVRRINIKQQQQIKLN
jgi:hypothetical protein